MDNSTTDVDVAVDVDADTITKEPENLVTEERSAKKLPVMEIFGPTIQGEGATIGQRTFFIRFGLCDYKCKMCDSMHAVDPASVKANAEWLTQEEIFARVSLAKSLYNCNWVTLSGGNPAIHDLTELVTAFRRIGMGINVETQGTFAPAWLLLCDYVTCSPKGPGMGEKFEPQKFELFYQKLIAHPGLSMKVVIFDARDLEFASMIAEVCPDIVGTDRFYLSCGNPFPPNIDGSSPTDDTDISVLIASIHRYKDLIDEIKDYKALRHARALPQLHTWLWGNAKGR